MSNFIKKQKGITLIALVITIIVLLILAGVAISMLSGENGILKQAANAKIQTEIQSKAESIKLGAISALTVGTGEIKTSSDLQAGLEQNGVKLDGTVTGEKENGYNIKTNDGDRYCIYSNGEIVPIITDVTKVTTEVAEKTIYEHSNEDKTETYQAVIPEGFKVSDQTKNQKINMGLVVVAPDGSEFVWVPVENAVYDSSNKNASKIATSSTNGSLTGYDYTPMAINVDGNYKGLLYQYDTTGGAYLMYSSATNYQGIATNNEGISPQGREPDYLPDTSKGDASTDANKGLNLLKSIVGIEGTIGIDNEKMLKTWSNQLQIEYNEMIKYVRRYKGFYVGRYETSLNGTKAQSIKGAKAATGKNSKGNANTWYGLYQKEKDYSKNNNLTNVVGSSMIWGSQYDQMMIWMQSNGINVKSKTPTNLEGVTTSRNKGTGSEVGTTGTVEKDKLNNIYDLLGNGREWTLQAAGVDIRMAESGSFSVDYTLTGGTGYYPYSDGGNMSSRITLYIK